MVSHSHRQSFAAIISEYQKHVYNATYFRQAAHHLLRPIIEKQKKAHLKIFMRVWRRAQAIPRLI